MQMAWLTYCLIMRILIYESVMTPSCWANHKMVLLGLIRQSDQHVAVKLINNNISWLPRFIKAEICICNVEFGLLL